MAFTTCNHFTFQTLQNPGFMYFYPQDISMLMNQTGARAVACVMATPTSAPTKSYPVLVAVNTTMGTPDISHILSSTTHFAALPCPPWGEVKGFTGGQFLPTPGWL